MATRVKPKAKARAKPASKKATTKKAVVKKAAKKPAVKKIVFRFAPTKLKLVRPVPSDIEIAQAGKIKPILQIAAEHSLAHIRPRSNWRSSSA
jgi:hypothetical protein